MPLTIFVDYKDAMVQNRPPHDIPASSCPLCRSSVVSGLYLFPLSFCDLEESSALRKRCSTAVQHDARDRARDGGLAGGGGGDAVVDKDDDDDDDLHKIQAEATPFLGLANSMTGDHYNQNYSGGEMDRSHNYHCRTGRWTPDEMTFVDNVIRHFESGLLPIPRGVKLNEILGDFLMCKSSRLTKKMKNAKLSARSYAFGDWRSGVTYCCATLSRLQDLFLKSIQTEPVRLELRFNLVRMWRVHFSNLCLQLSYERLDAKDWMASVEEMETRSMAAEDRVRNAQRRRMGLALLPSQEFAQLQQPLQVPAPQKLPAPVVSSTSLCNAGASRAAILSSPVESSSSTMASNQQITFADATSQFDGVAAPTPDGAGDSILESSNINPHVAAARRSSIGFDDENGTRRPRFQSDADLSLSRPRFFSEDLSVSMGGENDPLVEIDFSVGAGAAAPPFEFGNDTPESDYCSPFLSNVINYLMRTDVPFQHVDVWVPSFSSGTERSDSSPTIHKDSTDLYRKQQKQQSPALIQLCFAGAATRKDLASPNLVKCFRDFSLQSAGQSFAPGVGMPGRVYSTGMPTWENSIQNASQDHFKRSYAASLYGIRTAVAVPVSSPTVGRIVVALYSHEDVPRDVELVRRCFLEFQGYQPEPNWRLVIEAQQQRHKQQQRQEKQHIDELLPQGTAFTAAIAAGMTSSAVANQGPSAVSGGSGPCMKMMCDGSIAVPSCTASAALSVTSRGETPASSVPSHHSSAWRKNDGAPLCLSSSPSSTPAAPSEGVQVISGSDSTDIEDEQIATVLGKHMPLQEREDDSSSRVMGYVSLRLLLLRPSSRRSAEENDMVSIIRKSFRGYVQMSRRHAADVATLLVKDYMFLVSAASCAALRQTTSCLHAANLTANSVGVVAATASAADAPPPEDGLIESSQNREPYRGKRGATHHVHYGSIPTVSGIMEVRAGSAIGSNVAPQAQVLDSNSGSSQVSDGGGIGRALQFHGTAVRSEDQTPIRFKPLTYSASSSHISDDGNGALEEQEEEEERGEKEEDSSSTTRKRSAPKDSNPLKRAKPTLVPDS